MRQSNRQSMRCARALGAALVAWGLCLTSPIWAQAQDMLQRPPTTAACWIAVDTRLLVVRDVWSKRVSLPSAQCRGGERLSEAARRAAFESVGLVVEARTDVLWQTPSMATYACTVRGGKVLAHDDHVPLSHGGRRATMEALLLDAPALQNAAFVTPAQSAAVIGHLSMLADHTLPRAEAQTMRTSLGALLRAQLRGAHWLQRRVAFVPTRASPVATTGYMGFAAMTVGALVWVGTRWRQGAEWLLFALVTALVGAWLKDRCALPRPFHLDATLSPHGAFGYSFPSGITLEVTAVVGLALRQTRRHGWAVLAAVICFGCGLVCVTQGQNFMHDVVGAWVLGAALVLGYEAILRRANLAYVPLRAWLVVGVGIGMLAVGLSPLPWPTEAVGLLVGLCAGLPFCRRTAPGLSGPARLGLCAAMLVTLVVLAGTGHAVQEAAFTPGVRVAGRFVLAMAMGLVIPVWHTLGQRFARRVAG